MKRLKDTSARVCLGHVMWLVVLVLSACGGGGGGSSSGGGGKSSASNNNFSLKLNPETISAQCYETDFCRAEIKAIYQGTVPTGDVYVIATLDNNVKDFYYGLYETYADLTFALEPYRKKGNLTGQISIDVCADENCARRYGSRYTIPYTWKVLSNWPTFHLGVVGSSEQAESVNELNLSGNIGEPSPLYELKIDMPGTATSLGLPQDFIDRYKVKKISETLYQLQLPEGASSSKHYDFAFSGPGYSTSVSVTVNANVKRKMPLLPLQAVHTYFTDTFRGPRTVFAGNYGDGYCGKNIAQTLVLHGGGDWTRLDENGGCFVVLSMKEPATYGLYEATLKLLVPDEEPFELPVVMSYNKEKLEFSASDITITSATQEASLQAQQFIRFFSTNETLVVAPVSSWIKDVVPVSDNFGKGYNFKIDIDELKKINPASSGISAWEGVIKVDNTDPNGDFGIGAVNLKIKVPFVYAIGTKTTPAHLPFTQEIIGDGLSDFAGVEIVTLGKDDNGEYTKIMGKQFYYPSGGIRWDTRNGTATHDMPAMDKGVYQLNYAGIFSHHFPKSILTVE